MNYQKSSQIISGITEKEQKHKRKNDSDDTNEFPQTIVAEQQLIGNSNL